MSLVDKNQSITSSLKVRFCRDVMQCTEGHCIAQSMGLAL